MAKLRSVYRVGDQEPLVLISDSVVKGLIVVCQKKFSLNMTNMQTTVVADQ